MYRKFPPIIDPEIRKTQFLFWDSVTNEGTAESKPATVAPIPRRTNSDGSAQQSRVPKEVKSER